MSNQDDSTDGAEVVDFDALNAALGALPPAATSSSPMVGDSEGRSSATYSSSRPHTIPPSHAPNEDPNAPAVIVQTEETIPSGPPVQMTMPMGPGVNVVATAPHPAAGMPVDGMRPPMRSSASHPFTPGPFLPSGPPSDGNVNATMPMAALPRRPRTMTIVVRTTTGPSRGQKLAVFISMLVVFVGGGIAFLLLYKPSGINIDLRPPAVADRSTQARPTASASVAPVVAAPAVIVAPSSSVAAPSSSVSTPPAASSAPPTPSASATVVKKPKPPPRLLPPAP